MRVRAYHTDNNGFQCADIQEILADLCFVPGESSKLRRPRGISADWELFMQFTGESHSVATLILENLSNALGLEDQARYEKFDIGQSPSQPRQLHCSIIDTSKISLRTRVLDTSCIQILETSLFYSTRNRASRCAR
jgi:hypothetical protein